MADELQSSKCSRRWRISSAGCGGGGADGQLDTCSASMSDGCGSKAGWSPEAAKVGADGNAGSLGNSPAASCVTFQETAMETNSKLSTCGLSAYSVDIRRESFFAENPEMYPWKDTGYGLLTDPSSSEPSMNNISPCSSFGTNFVNPSHHQFTDILKSLQQRNFLNVNARHDTNQNWDFCSSSPMQLMKSTGLTLEERPKSYIHRMKPDSEAFRNSSSPAVLKKPRIETPSPLPTLKVRKEKLCDRITALQQLVSPFGKTDTASVLYEAIEYIKFLHEQVRALSSPYFPTGIQINNQQNLERAKEGQISQKKRQALRNRGLCLVPVSSTFAVACVEIPVADFWDLPDFDLSYI